VLLDRFLLFSGHGKRGIEFSAHNHSRPDQPEKEQYDYDPDKTAASQIAGKEAAPDGAAVTRGQPGIVVAPRGHLEQRFA